MAQALRGRATDDDRPDERVTPESVLAARDAAERERRDAARTVAMEHSNPVVYQVHTLVEQYGITQVLEAVRLIASLHGLTRNRD